MAQFDVYPNPGKSSRKYFPYLVDIQSPVISELATRIVIPLGNSSLFKQQALNNLTPEINYRNEAFLLLTPQISAVPAKLLNRPVGSLTHFREQIISALDFAVTGI